MQIWYCVSPKDRKRFEKLARSMFSQESHACAAFMRHKDILFSPKSLRSNGIEYTVVSEDAHPVVAAREIRTPSRCATFCQEAAHDQAADAL